MIRSVEIVDPLVNRSPVPNVLGVVTPEASAAFAPAGGEDPAAAFGVPAVEDHEVPAAVANVDWVIEVGAAASAVRSVGVDPGDAPPAAARRARRQLLMDRIHARRLDRSSPIVDPRRVPTSDRR